MFCTAPFSGPAGSGFWVSEFRILYGVWGCGARGMARHERHMSHRTRRVSPGRTLGVLGGRATGKEGRKGTEWTPDPGKEKPLEGT